MSAAKLKIGFVLDDTLDSTDGIQQYILTLSQWLKNRGHTVHFIVGETHRSDLEHVHSMAKNIKVKFNGNTTSMPLPASATKLREVVRDNSLDIVHVQMPYSPFMSGMLIRSLPTSVGLVGTFHILPYGTLVKVANRMLKGLTFGTDRRFDEIMSVSQPAADFARTAYGYSSTVVPNPVEVQRFMKTASPDPSDTVQIVFLGRLVERKGALQLLHAIAYLKNVLKYGGSFRVVIGGKGPLMETLKVFVSEQKLEAIVEFAGFVAEEDKVSFLSAADIAVFPSISGESFGISVVEALAASRGVILAGNNPGYASVLHDLPESLINPKDTKAFAETIARWLDDSAARETVARRQKDYAMQFDIEQVGPRVEAVYYHSLQNRRRS